MSVAARISRLAMVAAIAATAALSVAAASSPLAVQAAVVQPAVSAVSVQSAVSVVSVESTRTSSTRTISARALIVRDAESHVGAQYRFGAEGPTQFFDCSGLVWAVYKQAGLADKISGVRRGAKGYLKWFRERHLASKTNPRPGDLVIWNNGHHIGIYVGNGMAVSALNRRYGVREHPIGFVHTFTTYLHVQINGRVPVPTNGGSTGGSTGSGGGGSTTVTVKTTVDGVVVRNGPGNGYRAVAVVAKGTIIEATGKKLDRQGREWVEGKLPSGKIGWVRARHVKVV
jgi:cell wall-associated NlpC family hydrolase